MRIGRRSLVRDIRELWSTETKFSDWLATEKGTELLAQDLSIEVENLVRECRGSDFPCDLVGNIVGDENHAVVIENQYGKTDHDHLGKFLTYAATQKALTCIWIAERIADDHRAAVDWLNANTPESFSFFVAELKAYRIEDSPAAPQLDVVCKPNMSIKPTRQGESQADKDRGDWRRQFWTEIHDSLRAQRPSFSLQAPSSSSWSTIALGRSGIHMNMDLTPKRKCIGLSTIINGPNKDAWFQDLELVKIKVEEILGEQLTWIQQRGEKSAAVVLESGIDPKNDSNREAVKEWFCKMVPIWHKVFSEAAALMEK